MFSKTPINELAQSISEMPDKLLYRSDEIASAIKSAAPYVRSNRESGFGRFDVQLEPISKEMPGIIFELKFDRNEDADLDTLLVEAAQQIEEKRYDVEMKARGVREIIRIGIAFAGKRVKLQQA